MHCDPLVKQFVRNFFYLPRFDRNTYLSVTSVWYVKRKPSKTATDFICFSLIAMPFLYLFIYLFFFPFKFYYTIIER